MYLHKNNKKFLFMLMVLMSSGTFIWGMDFNNQKIGGRQKESGHGVEVLPMPIVVVPLEAVPVVQAQRVQSEVVQREFVASNSKWLRCKFEGCGYVAISASKLKIHVRTHTGEKPYVCGIGGCVYAAKAQCDLSKHKRTHTGEKPYVCGIDGCIFATAVSGHLTIHRRTHTGAKPYVCGIDGCKYAAAQNCDLTTHQRTHTGAKPYVCDIDGCVYVTAVSGNLIAHKRTHADGGPHSCKYPGCQCCFRTSYALACHVKQHLQEQNISVAGKREREESTQDVSQDRNSKRSKNNQGLITGVSEAVGWIGSWQQLEPLLPTVVPLEAVPVVQAQRVQLEVVQRELVAPNGERFRCKFEGCGHVEKYASMLKIHVRTHTGEKPFQCGIDGCKFATAQKINLTRHQKLHTNGGQNRCNYEGCKCCFKAPNALTYHKKEHLQEQNISVAGKREREESTQDVSQDRNSKRSKNNQRLTKGVSGAVGLAGSSQQLEPRFAKVVPAETIECVSLDDANSAEFDAFGNGALEGSDSCSDFDASKCTGQLSCALPEPREIWDELECEPYAVSCTDADVEGESFGALDAGANVGAVEVQGGDGDERWMEYVNFDGLSDSEKI